MTMITVLAGLSFLLLGGLAMRLIFAPETGQERARSKRIQARAPQNRGGMAEDLVRAEAKGSIGREWPVVGNITLLLFRAGLAGRGAFVALVALSVGLIFGALLSIPAGPLLGFPIALIVAGLITMNVLKGRHRRRVNVLTQQLPDALELMMRGLRVGHPINATITNVARTMADPIGGEFRTLGEQISHGDYLTEAFKDFAERVGQEDVEYLSVAISIQHGTGGNLAEMLGTLSQVVRERTVMRRRIMAISSEGRLSAWLLSALPVVIYLATSLTSPDYYGGVSDDPLFQSFAVAIVALVVANFFALRKLVSFDI